MTAYLAILRGVNVSGHRRIKMAALERVFWELGYSSVATFIQSGNVIFASPSRNSAELASTIEERLVAELGFLVRVLIRSRDELAAVIRENPFIGEGTDVAELHLTFLAGTPSRSVGLAADQGPYAPDRFRLGICEVYLHCPFGYGRTKLHNGFWERRLGVVATTRNWNTVTRLMGLLDGLPVA